MATSSQQKLWRTTALTGMATVLLGALALPGASAGSAPQVTGQTRTLGAGAATAGLGSVAGAIVVTDAVDLCAKEGTLTLPGATTVPIWGFGVKAPGVDCADVEVTLPGPVLEVTAGSTISVTLHNGLSENVSLAFPAQAVPPDPDGAAPSTSKTYTFQAAAPGTFLYETGTNPTRQIAMGLFGAMVVRPTDAPAQAYDDPATAFDREQVLVLSEVDPAFNANPAGFDMTAFAPRYWLINGRAYPDASLSISVAAEERVLLRYANAGVHHHSMSLLGARQQVLAKDGHPSLTSAAVVGEMIPAGQTLDALVTVPAGAGGERLPLYERGLRLTNGASFPGGMLAFLEVTP